jgi:signal transduction histidine kinase/FixJ family two-component response regulator
MAEPVILVVDDEPHIVRLCQRILQNEHFSVVGVTSGHQAVEYLSRQAADLLLVDVRMPDMDGFQVINAARALLPDLAVVIMTGFGTVETAIQALRRGADGLLLKPFNLDDLVETVRDALRERERRQDAAAAHSLRPLFEVGERLFSEVDPEKLMEVIVTVVAEQLRCSATALFQYDQQKKQYQLAARWGQPIPEGWCQTRDSFAKKMLADEGPALISVDQQVQTEMEAKIKQAGFSSCLCVPILHQAGMDLLIALRGADQPAFRKPDLDLFVILTRQSGLALENAGLYEKERQYVQQIERTRQAMDRTERMVAAGRLTASIAHEINNPLQSLSNCLHLAGRSELDSQDRQKYLSLANTEMDRLMQIVQQMLDFYRPGVRDRRMVNLNEIINQVLLMMQAQLEGGDIEIETDLVGNLSAVMVVASQIKQVLINLILNAMEAMPGGGKVYIRTIYPDWDGSGTRGVSIFVEDTGPGIPSEQSERIFEPFTSSKEQGTGLGLSVSEGFVSAHGGSLTLVSGGEARADAGACFRIFLPEGERL